MPSPLEALFRRIDYDTHWVQPADRRNMHSVASQTELMGRVMRTWLPLSSLVFLALITAGLMIGKGTLVSKLTGLAAIVGFNLIAMSPLAFIAWRARALSNRMAEVARALAGTCTRDKLGVVIEWLDRYWPWPTRVSVLLYGSMGARRWCAVGSYAGLGVLVAAQRRMAMKAAPSVYRIDIYVAGRRVNPAAQERLVPVARANGFEVEVAEAGVHFLRRDTDPDALAPARFSALLESARAAFT
jgi:hypothetical protein